MDKVVLRPKAFFLPKVYSSSHLNQGIFLSSLCPVLKQPKKIRFLTYLKKSFTWSLNQDIGPSFVFFYDLLLKYL